MVKFVRTNAMGRKNNGCIKLEFTHCSKLNQDDYVYSYNDTLWGDHTKEVPWQLLKVINNAIFQHHGIKPKACYVLIRQRRKHLDVPHVIKTLRSLYC